METNNMFKTQLLLARLLLQHILYLIDTLLLRVRLGITQHFHHGCNKREEQ